MATALAPLSVEQKKTFEIMPKAWQVLAKKAIDRKQTRDVNLIKERYDLGLDVIALRDGSEKKFGEEAIPSLAVVLGEKEQVLWHCVQVVETYDWEDIEKLASRQGLGGKKISFFHLELLSSDLFHGKNGDRLRRDFEGRIINEGMSVEELRRAINKQFNVKTETRKTGRKVSKPKSFRDGVMDIEKTSLKYNNRWDGWKEVVAGNAQTIGADEITEPVVEEMKTAKENLETVLEHTKTLIGQLSAGIRRAEKILAKQGNGAPTGRKRKVKTAAKKKVRKKKRKAPIAETNGHTPKRKVKKKVLKKVKRRSARDRVANARGRKPTPA